MDSSKNALYGAAGIPAIMLLPVTCHIPPNQSGQQEHSADMGKEGHSEVCEEISGHLTEQYGGGTQRSPGSIFLPRRRQNLHLPSDGDVAEHSEEPAFRENAKRLQGRRHQNPQDNNGKGPSDPCVNSAGIFTKSGSRDNASDGQSSNDEGISRKCDRE